MATTVKVSSRNQIVVPRQAREQLKIKPGDRLIVDVQGDLMVLLLEPKSYTQRLSGLGREIWEKIDTDAYLNAERDAW
jgi:AbrB family looped-hinge helix DNA binding protein